MARKRNEQGRSGAIPPPKCKAILLCDQVIVDRLSGKKSVIGVFEGFLLPSFPGKTSSCMAFVELTSGIGNYQLTMEVRDLADGRAIALATGPVVTFPARATRVHIIMPLPPIQLSHAGKYDFVVLADGQEIDRQQFEARSTGSSRRRKSDAQN